MSAPLNTTAAALLGLLHDRPMTGGELVAAAGDRFGAFWTVTRSQVYRELPGLADAGHVRPGKAGPRSAQPYAITAAGRRAFAAWLAEPAGPDHLRSPLLLRLGFGDRHTKPQLRQLLDGARSDHEAALARARSRLGALRQTDADEHLVAATEFVVAYERMMLKWLDNVPAE